MRTANGLIRYSNDIAEEEIIILEELPNGWWKVGFKGDASIQHTNNDGCIVSKEVYQQKKRELIISQL